MTQAELKIETLKVIDNDGERLTTDKVSNYEDDATYSAYLLAFNGAFNRAVQRLVDLNKLHLKVVTISLNKENMINLIEHATDIKKVVRITFKTTNNKYIQPEYSIISNQYLMLNQSIEGTATIFYHRRIPYILEDNQAELSSYGINENLETILPYGIAGDLVFSENASKGQYFRNVFETYLGEKQEEEFIEIQTQVINNFY